MTGVQSLTGVVTQVSWQNPHMRIYVDVTDAKGAVTNYNLELDSPNNLLPASEIQISSVGMSQRHMPTFAAVAAISNRCSSSRSSA